MNDEFVSRKIRARRSVGTINPNERCGCTRLLTHTFLTHTHAWLSCGTLYPRCWVKEGDGLRFHVQHVGLTGWRQSISSGLSLPLSTCPHQRRPRSYSPISALTSLRYIFST